MNSYIFLRVKEILRTSYCTEILYNTIYHIYHKKKKRKQHQAIERNGICTVKKIQNIMSHCGIPFFFDMGTMLGIVREEQLLSGDNDIDIGILISAEKDIEKVRKWLISSGCQIRRKYVVKDIGEALDSFCINDIEFDVCYYRRWHQKSICYLFYDNPEIINPPGILNVVRLECDAIEDIVKYPFQNSCVNIPINYERYLENRYGNSWKVPDRGYVYWKGPSAKPISNIGYLHN